MNAFVKKRHNLIIDVIKSIKGGAMVVPKTFRILANFEKSLN